MSRLLVLTIKAARAVVQLMRSRLWSSLLLTLLEVEAGAEARPGDKFTAVARTVACGTATGGSRELPLLSSLESRKIASQQR